MSEKDATDDSTAGQPPAPGTQPRATWAWPLTLGALVAIGVLLAIADIAIDSPWLRPFAYAIVGPSGAPSPRTGGLLESQRFDRTPFGPRFTFAGPFGSRGPISPLQAIRALLSNGGGLIFLALGVLVLFPRRVRMAVERLEVRHGPEIALVAGVATVLLALAAVILVRFTVIFLAAIPIVLAVALATAVFGIACIAFASGRFLQRRLRLNETNPFVVGLAGSLVIFDLAVIPYAGALALAAVAIAGLGLAVITRFGSDMGWSLSELDW